MEKSNERNGGSRARISNNKKKWYGLVPSRDLKTGGGIQAFRLKFLTRSSLRGMSPFGSRRAKSVSRQTGSEHSSRSWTSEEPSKGTTTSPGSAYRRPMSPCKMELSDATRSAYTMDAPSAGFTSTKK